MQMRFFRPVHGPSRCEGRLLRPGRRIVHLESRLYDEQNRLAATATSSWQRLDHQSSSDTSLTNPVPGNT
jgi:acyl-CoA thioesterase